MYSLGNQQVQVSQVIKISNERKAQEQASADEETVNAISDNLVAAQSKQALSVKFSADDAPVENGMFIFSIESEDEGSKEMTFQVFDEEEFELAANNVITVNQGENYKALNVGGLDNGSYTFRLKDGQGGEQDHAIVVQNK
ncbi:MAG: T9SS C-terminal target domain-containing protein [Saprospiraceae bacterium]|nr:T9SS C-terminal target domain-containing protein [Saprospiraceae bacterium]